MLGGLGKKAVQVALIYASDAEPTTAHFSPSVPGYPLIRHRLVGYILKHNWQSCGPFSRQSQIFISDKI
jgi:hypothetical protein